MSSPVEQIKEKLGIVDVVGSYLTLEKAGANFKARCPFHNEKTPSFFVSPARNSYYCFGCGAKGDILSFVQDFEGLDFVGALRVLAKRAGVELERENPKVRSERERLYLMLEHATLFFQKKLGDNTAARNYLKKRGITAETARGWRLGYAPVEWRTLAQYLKTKGFRNEDIERAGLAKKSEKVSGDYYDRFRGRIMFPIFDSSGRVIAFSGRQFESDGTEAKYINSPETPLFEKSKVLYGFDRAKLDIRRRDFSLLVEGQMDLLMSHQSGFTNAVASSGTALTPEQLEILKRLSKNLVIAYDGDAAGSAAAARGWQLALAAGMDVKIAAFPEGKDPADLVLEDPTIYAAAIENARHIIDVELDRIMKTELDERRRGIAVEQTLLPYIADIESAIEKSHFVTKISQRVGLKEEVVWQEVRKLEEKGQGKGEPTPATQVARARSRRQSIERMIFGILFWQERQERPAVSVLDIKQKLCNIIGKEQTEAYETQEESAKDELMFEAEVSYEKSADLSRHVEELLRNLEEESLRERFAVAMRDLQKAERERDTDTALTLLKICQEISEKLRSLAPSNQ